MLGDEVGLNPSSRKLLRLVKVILLIITALTTEVIKMAIRRTRIIIIIIVIGMILFIIAKQSSFILANKIKINSNSSDNNIDINKLNACHTVMPS